MRPHTHHSTRRLAAALGAAALTVGFGLAAAGPAYAHGASCCGGGAGRSSGFAGSDDNGKHLGQIKNGSTPGDNGLHTGDPN